MFCALGLHVFPCPECFRSVRLWTCLRGRMRHAQLGVPSSHSDQSVGTHPCCLDRQLQAVHCSLADRLHDLRFTMVPRTIYLDRDLAMSAVMVLPGGFLRGIRSSSNRDAVSIRPALLHVVRPCGRGSAHFAQPLVQNVSTRSPASVASDFGLPVFTMVEDPDARGIAAWAF